MKKWMTDTEVSIKGYRHHDERGERHTPGDKEHVKTTHGIVAMLVVQRYRDDVEGNNQQTREEVRGRQGQDEDARGGLLLFPKVYI